MYRPLCVVNCFDCLAQAVGSHVISLELGNVGGSVSRVHVLADQLVGNQVLVVPSLGLGNLLECVRPECNSCVAHSLGSCNAAPYRNFYVLVVANLGQGGSVSQVAAETLGGQSQGRGQVAGLNVLGSSSGLRDNEVQVGRALRSEPDR